MPLFSFGGYLSRFADWGGAFLSVRDFQRNENGKSILVIDEFPYAVMGNREIPSILQKQWDTVLKDENVMIILCGNAMSFIEKEILAEKNPLYGRAGGICRMDEMPYYDAVKSVKEYTPAEKATVYSICGGVPYYLEQFDTAFSLKENILRSVLTKGSILYSEPGFLLRQELREPSVYNSVISSIANGRTKLSEIQDDLMMEKNKLSVYLRNLIEPGLAERAVECSRSDRTSIQRGLYRIRNPFFRFWYAFVFPNLSLLEFGDTETVCKRLIEERLEQFVSSTSEDICIEYMKYRNMTLSLPFVFTECRQKVEQNDGD